MDRYLTVEKRYWLEYNYDETAKKSSSENGAGSEMGMLCDVDLSNILSGYELIGWNTNEADAKQGIKTYDLSTAKDAPLTNENHVTIDLYSVFELIPVTIVFDINDSSKGTGSTAANKSVFTKQTIHLGDTLSFLDDDEYTDATISRPGYDFLGWSKVNYGSMWNNLGPTVGPYPHIDLDICKSSEKFYLGLVPNTDSSDSSRANASVTNNYLLQALPTTAKPQQSLKQTISSGNFAKTSVSTSNLTVTTLLKGTNS